MEKDLFFSFSNIHINLFGWRFTLDFLAVPVSDLLMTRYIIRMKFLSKKSLAHALCKTTFQNFPFVKLRLNKKCLLKYWFFAILGQRDIEIDDSCSFCKKSSIIEVYHCNGLFRDFGCCKFHLVSREMKT